MEGTKLRVLLADDDAHIRRILSLKLEQAGYLVTTARDGREAADAAKDARPDILITDYNMPEMTGLDLCRELERHDTTASIPTIMLTSHDFRILPEQMKGTSIKQVLGKPFSPRQVIAMIESLASTARQRSDETCHVPVSRE